MSRAGCVVLAALACARFACAQGIGPYFNVESPQCKPIAVATVDGHDYLLVCNTPDNSVEIYDTVNTAHVHTVRVGAEPVSVVWNQEHSRFYTTNFLGDSVSVVLLEPDADAVSGLKITFERTSYVGDEPMHIGFTSDNQSAFVTLNSQSAFAWINALTLAAIAARIDLVDAYSVPATKALKGPRNLLVAGSSVFALGFHGGKVPTTAFQYRLTPSPTVQAYDFDLWSLDFATNTVRTLGGLGTNNFSMTFDAAGDLYVVGTMSAIETRGEGALQAMALPNSASTGFVQTMIYRVTSPGTNGAVVAMRDLNKTPVPNATPVAFTESLAHSTDVVIYEPSGGPKRVIVAAFNSDRIGILDPTGNPDAWPFVARINIAPVRSSTKPLTMAGPRGLVVKYAKAITGDPGDRVYVLNRIDNSVSVIDPATWTLAIPTFLLKRDPRPSYIPDGAVFLYSCKLSGNGTVSCSSCHHDARDDRLAWDNSNGQSSPFPSGFVDGLIGQTSPANSFTAFKGFMVTQSLQGLVNYEVNPDAQGFFSNQPYYWRGRRVDFPDFGGAFVNLMGLPVASQPTPADMTDFTRFINSVAYPPNPEQPLDRVYSGTLGAANDETQGTGGLRGLKLFHTRGMLSNGASQASVAGRSCVQCHALPEGSNNKSTVFTPSFIQPLNPQEPFAHALESAALRQLRQKERVVQRGVVPFSTVASGMFGLEHEGLTNSINTFINDTFSSEFSIPEIVDLIQFVREFDPGVAPLVGTPLTVDQTNMASTPVLSAIAVAEDQARKTNLGVSVKGWILNQTTGLLVERGFWFDITANTPTTLVYREEPSGARFTQAGLLALLAQPSSHPSERLVFEATPLGSERRWCWPGTGLPPALQGSAPTNVRLEPMQPSTPWKDVPLFTKNWVPGTGANDFNWTGGPFGVGTPPSLRALRIFQQGAINDDPYYATAALLRHEPSRRFQVVGDDIRHGAKLILRMNIDVANPPQDPPVNPNLLLPFVLPIYPTDTFNVDGRRIWQTAAEVDATVSYMMILGGPAAPNVGNVLNQTFTTEPPAAQTFDPTNWNLYRTAVINEDNTLGYNGLQRIRIQ